ncbi:hypothetical protein F4777DRAFT_71985 [Nemania sp. FL0916]|nr:hypothetical protein F4777DRAFT_71985 [Nemania sp. FL0916]
MAGCMRPGSAGWVGLVWSGLVWFARRGNILFCTYLHGMSSMLRHLLKKMLEYCTLTVKKPVVNTCCIILA